MKSVPLKDKIKEKVNDISNEVIKKQIEAWKTRFEDNNNRGKSMIDFITKGEQWDFTQAAKRRMSNKESLIFNLCWKENKKMKSQIAEIEFSINAFPTTKQAQSNVEETNTFNILMENIILEKKVIEKYSSTFKRCVDFGYSFGQVDFRRINNDDLCLYPVYIDHQDPTTGFWDLKAYTKTKIDGRYAGFTRRLTKKELRARYSSKLLSKCFVSDLDNVVTDYWFRQEADKEFVLLLSGIYKRKDLLSFDDKNNLMTKDRLRQLRLAGEIEEDLPLEKKEKVSCIFFKRICNDINLEEPRLFPTDNLPIVYHPSGTHWTYDNYNFTVPFGYHLKGTQQLYNYLNSQIATQAKACTSDKWLFNSEHVSTPEQTQNAKDINKIEGGIDFGGNIAEIRRERPAELSASLIQMSQTMKQVVDEIGGASIDANNAQQTVISGVALDKITKNMKIINDEAIADHIVFVNDIGKLFGEMLPRVVTEQRTMVVKLKDGTGKPLIINEELDTGELGNDISSINNKFQYDIKAGANSDIEKENVVRYLTQVYQINPQLLSTTGDIFFRNLNCKDAGELSLRVLADMDNNLIKFSQGLISQDEYNQAKQQEQQQQLAAQTEALKTDPTYQSAVAVSAAEQEKASAAKKNADTTRIKVLAEAIGKEADRDIEIAKVLLEAHQGEANHAVDTLHAQLAVNDQMVEKMREVIGDNDLALQGENQPGAPNAAGDNPDQTPQQAEGQQSPVPGDPNAG